MPMSHNKYIHNSADADFAFGVTFCVCCQLLGPLLEPVYIKLTVN